MNMQLLLSFGWQLVKENGGLKRFVALITDQPPPEEDNKKGDKKAGSRAGKKSAKEGEDCSPLGLVNFHSL